MVEESKADRLFSIHIDFYDGSNPIVYFNKKLGEIGHILEEWSVNWILIPMKDCKLSDDIWYFHARERQNNGLSWPEFKETII